MAFQLPTAEKIEELLKPICRDERSREFVHWFAQHSSGKTLLNEQALGAELASALDDYARESGEKQVVVKAWYHLYAKAWEKALVS